MAGTDPCHRCGTGSRQPEHEFGFCETCATWSLRLGAYMDALQQDYPTRVGAGRVTLEIRAAQKEWVKAHHAVFKALSKTGAYKVDNAITLLNGARAYHAKNGFWKESLERFVAAKGEKKPPAPISVHQRQRLRAITRGVATSSNATVKSGTRTGPALLAAALQAAERGEAAPIRRDLVTEAPADVRPEQPPDQVPVVPAARSDAVDRELAARELARRKLLRFILRMYPQYKAGWFHIDLCERLEKFSDAIIQGKSPRLMLSVPPRHGKSMIVSQFFPAWHMGRYPTQEIIAASYGQDLSNDFSFKIQELIQSEVYRQIFPRCELQAGRQSIETWRTTAGGQYVAAGAGGPLTGRGANLLDIDDPLKNREEADSAAVRDRIYKWYTSTAYTRLMPGAGVLLTATRWHDADLIGALEADYKVALRQLADDGVFPEDADRWEIVSYPAIAVEDEKWRRKGEALHPERYGVGALNKIKRTLGPRDWAALYQQTPVPDEGGFFKAEWVRYIDAMPSLAEMGIYAAADLAVSKKDSADFTVIIIVGVDKAGNIWVLDMRRGRWNASEIIDQLFDVQKVWNPQVIGIEEGQIASSMGPFLDQRIQDEKMFGMVIELLKIKRQDKEARARPMQGRMQQGMVHFLRNAPWTTELVNELLRFPSGVHDDCVDALAWIGQMLTTMTSKPREGTKLESWRDKLHKIVGAQTTDENSWMAA